MSAASPPRRLSRKGLHGLLLLAGAAVVLFAAAYLPFYWQKETDTRLAERQIELRLIEARLQKAAQGRVARLTESDRPELMFLSGTTSGLAQAGFQRLIDQTASEHGMVIERLQPIEASRDGDLTTYRMDVVAKGSLESLSAFLLALEKMLPVLFVAEAQIAPDEAQRVADPEYPSESLTLAMQVEAYGWSGEAAP
jgi:hypothetical protein